jgi:hypothetical protein
MVALRLVVFGFSATFTVTLPLLEPDDGLTVHQLSLLFTVQETFDVMLNELLPPEDAKFNFDGLMLKNGSGSGVEPLAFSVTVTLADTVPVSSVKVIIACLFAPVLFGELTAISISLPPDALFGFILNQMPELLAVHEVLEVTIIFADPLGSRVTEVGLTDSFTPSPPAESPPQFTKKSTAHSPVSTLKIVFFFIIL